MANLERIAEIRDYLQDQVPDTKFNMTTWGLTDQSTAKMNISCESPACIAGHVCHYFETGMLVNDLIWNAAKTELGLDFGQAAELFGCPPGSPQTNATPQDAAKVLDYFLQTGKFDWAHVMDKQAEPELVPA